MASSPRQIRTRPPHELDRALAACRRTVLVLAGFGFAINLLVLAAPLYMIQVYDRVMVTGHIDTLVMLTLLAGAALLLHGLLEGLRSGITARMGAWLGTQVAPALVAGGVRARLAGDGAGAQPLRDLAQVQNFVTSPALPVFFDLPWTPVFVLLLWLLHPLLGQLGLAATVLLFVLGWLNDRVTRGPSQAANQALLSSTQQADTAIRNAEVVRAMGMLPALLARWDRAHHAATEGQRRAAARSGTIVGLTKFVRLFLQSAMLGLGALLVLRGETSAGAMIASSVLLSRALAPVEIVMGSWRSFGAAQLALARVRARLDGIAPEPRRTRLPAPAGFIAVDRVTYTPPGARAPVLHAVSFACVPGEAIAVIGPSASGKSSLCRILVGIARPDSGEVRIDGAELSQWSPDALGPHVGYLPQDVELFGGTVRDNISRMTEPDDEAVVRAAKLAHAHDMILKLPQGYDTPMGEGGMRLSGGQRQRIGLARAVYGDPRLIVLDEPNANLDQAGEAALGAAIAELKQSGATVLIVGHRPSTIASADKVLALKEGKVELFRERDEVLRRLRRGPSADGESQPAGPRQVEPQAIGPQSIGQQTVEPRQVGSRQAGSPVEPLQLGGRHA